MKPRPGYQPKTDRRVRPEKSHAIRTVDDLKSRCVVDDETGCWRCKTKTVAFCIGEERFNTTIRRAALILAGRKVPTTQARLAGPTANCHTDWCGNPDHSRVMSRKENAKRLGLAQRMTPKQLANLRAHSEKCMKLCADDRRVIATTRDEPIKVMAQRYGVSEAYVQRMRSRGWSTAKRPATSVFTFRP